jgi:hypothetical protein
MADAAFFRKNWKLVGLNPKDDPNVSTYPPSHSLIIGNDRSQNGAFMVAWLDEIGDLHVFRQLQLVDGKLVGEAVVDLGSGDLEDQFWRVTIEQDGDTSNLKGTVVNLRGVEASLAGTWGAEPQPPFNEPRRPASPGPGLFVP